MENTKELQTGVTNEAPEKHKTLITSGGGYFNVDKSSENDDNVKRTIDMIDKAYGVTHLGEGRYEIKNPLHILNHNLYMSLYELGMKGEVIFVAPDAKAEDVELLTKYRSRDTTTTSVETTEDKKGAVIVERIVERGEGFRVKNCNMGQLDDGSITVLWTPDVGALITASIEHYRKFQELFGAKGVPNNEGTRWLSLKPPITRADVRSKIETDPEECFGLMYHRHKEYIFRDEKSE